ncbi:DUF3310 domain-containing protein [Streptomyces sp. NPDC002730]|uniref:DUF3310 domain-containing protein n=1 Tax=Streptomyces sp. NPDC002730 TaxID=3364662 RepID=UPI00369373D7
MRYVVGDSVKVIGNGAHSGYRGRVFSVNSHITAPYPYGVKLHVGGRLKYLNMAEDELEPDTSPVDITKTVDHPAHYTWIPNGIEVIDLVEHLNFSRGNAVKYICRAGKKSVSTELEDLKKALWYVEREIQRVEKRDGTPS